LYGLVSYRGDSDYRRGVDMLNDWKACYTCGDAGGICWSNSKECWYPMGEVKIYEEVEI
jgi:hypothetical protein